MNTNDPNAVQWITLAVAIVAVAALFLVVPGQVNRAVSEIPMPAVPTAADIASAVDVPTAAEVAALIVVPQAPIAITPEVQEVSNSRVDRLCKLTEGCEFYEGNMSWLSALDNDDAEEDFFDDMVDFTGIDEDYLVVQSPHPPIDMKDWWQIRAYTEKDKDDDNWEIKTFIKVRYYDSDEASSFTDNDAEYAYLVVTSTLDEGDYDNLSFEEVARSFEFE